jgi:hypothetical protein
VERRRSIDLAGRRILIDSSHDATLQLADEGCSGTSDLTADIIRIRYDLTDEQYEETLLHELLHYVWHLTALPHLIEEHEETVVRSLAPWLHTLVKLRA